MIQNKMSLCSTNNIPFSEWLQKQLNARKWSQTTLVQQSQGFIKSRSIVSAWINHDKKPRTSGYVGISLALSIPIDEVLYHAGEAPPSPQSVEGEVELVSTFRKMNEDQRGSYLQMGQGLVVMNKLFGPQNGNGHQNVTKALRMAKT